MSWRNLIWMSIILCLAGLALYLSRRRSPQLLPEDPAVKDLTAVVEAYKTIKKNGYRDFPAGEACRGAIEGMARRVDEFSAYIPPEKAGNFTRRAEGALEETGLRIAREGDALVVVGALPGSPAHKAGLSAGMELLAIDGQEAEYLTLQQARKMLESPEKKDVALLLRSVDGKKLELTLEVSRFDVETVTGIVRDDNGDWVHELDKKAQIYYIRISEFVQRTPGELQAVYRRLDGPRAVVLDLRDNPGGMLPPAVEVADRFLTGRLVIVRTVSRDGRQKTHRAHSDSTYPLVPTVVLINGQTASAAEIVAGAIRAHGRATLVGVPSYGKWHGQTLVDLGHGLGHLYLTTTEYFLAEPDPTTAPHVPAATGVEAPQAGFSTTAPGRTDRRCLQPDALVRIPARRAERLELLRLKAQVAAQPAYVASATAPTRRTRWEDLRRSILELDNQLAYAVRLLRSGKVPTTRPAGTSAPHRAGTEQPKPANDPKK